MFEIYVITNKLNGRRYVGQTSRSYLDRFNEHCYYAYIHPKLNKYLAKDIRVFGKDKTRIVALRAFEGCTHIYPKVDII